MARTATAKSTDDAVKVVPIGPTSNAGAGAIDLSQPFAVEVQLTGACDLLFHRWQDEAVEQKAKAAKNSKAKKTDDIEAYVWRDKENHLCIPGEYLRRSMVEAAKFRQDPRSPRKSAYDLANASIISLTELASLGITTWDFLHKGRVRVQRAAVTRVRPGVASGWKATFIIGILVPEYIDPAFLRDLLDKSGKLIGLADNRPSYGRFDVTHFEILNNF